LPTFFYSKPKQNVQTIRVWQHLHIIQKFVFIKKPQQNRFFVLVAWYNIYFEVLTEPDTITSFFKEKWLSKSTYIWIQLLPWKVVFWKKNMSSWLAFDSQDNSIQSRNMILLLPDFWWISDSNFFSFLEAI
jgi:hypothetical protein